MPDINGANWSACVSGGMKYHIHMLWEHDDTTDQFGSTMCGADYTGGHWDPWQACGSATGNPYCSVKGGCIDDGYSADDNVWRGLYWRTLGSMASMRKCDRKPNV